MTRYKVGWLDSAKMPSRVHVTDDDGETTRCGYPIGRNFREGVWTLVSSVQQTSHGNSHWCQKCLEGITKTRLKWLAPWSESSLISTLDRWEQVLEMRRDRLARLVSLDAPEEIITTERRMVLEAEGVVKTWNEKPS